MDAIAETHHARRALAALMSRVHNLITSRVAHPARTVVLLPFAHLLQPARQAWGRLVPDGFAPRFETTQTWSAARWFDVAPHDFSGDPARDLIAARAWLERAGLGGRAQLLAGRVADAAAQLRPVAEAIEPSAREAWAARARRASASGLDSPLLALEAAVGQVAIEWLAASAFAGDALFDAAAWRDIELAVIVQGSRADALADALASRHSSVAVRLELDGDGDRGDIALHAADSPADEAERAAACVLRHVREGRVPVALPAVDRVLTRRVRAMLDAAGAAIRDETGWKLSTTRAAANAMAALKACAWNAASDAVLDWMKNAPALREWQVLALERRVRRSGVREWRGVGSEGMADGLQASLAQVNEWRAAMESARVLGEWLASFRELLRATGAWGVLERDPAGTLVLDVLRLRERDAQDVARWPAASRRWTLAEFTAWVADALEAASFIPAAAPDAQVVILPLHQMLGREFAALVVAGCDEVRLPAAPEPGGAWTPRQRAELGLPTREALEAETRAAWRHALQTPACDVLWRRSDESGEALLASPLVQALELEGAAYPGTDPRAVERIDNARVARPAAVASRLPVEQLSASAYEDLRRCPYRFFALRQLGLQEPEEIDTDLDKRDFGSWLHQVLRRFHEREQGRDAPVAGRAARLDAAAEEVTRMSNLDEGEFLPFRAAWPQVRDGYLAWLASHQQQGATFRAAEVDKEEPLGPIRLVGRLDRVDELAQGVPFVIDYKTEPSQTTRDRVGHASEDTQLAFYAALLGDDRVRAAYVNVGERGETRTYEQKDVIAARDGLLRGIADEIGRVAGGAPMPALGEGVACEYCGARGLCRKDFWS
jgi:ATP-dependent helicase/nuclease subunit B